MGMHVFDEIYLHFNWHTQGNLSLLTDGIEGTVRTFIRDRCRNTKGVRFFGIGGTADHLHLVVKVEPFVAPSKLIADLKGASAREINKRTRRQALRWQRGFGVVSFAKRHLRGVLQYVAQQKEHHASGTVKDTLEHCDAGQQSETQQPFREARLKPAFRVCCVAPIPPPESGGNPAFGGTCRLKPGVENCQCLGEWRAG